MTNTFTPQEQTNEFSISAVCSKCERTVWMHKKSFISYYCL